MEEIKQVVTEVIGALKLKDIQASISKLNWESVILSCRTNHGTRFQMTVRLNS